MNFVPWQTATLPRQPNTSYEGLKVIDTAIASPAYALVLAATLLFTGGAPNANGLGAGGSSLTLVNGSTVTTTPDGSYGGEGIHSFTSESGGLDLLEGGSKYSHTSSYGNGKEVYQLQTTGTIICYQVLRGHKPL